MTIEKARRTAAAALAVLALAPASGLAAQLSERAIEGARIYGDVCGRCHNPRSPLERTDDEWVIIVNHMRIRGNLTGVQSRAVLAFLQAANINPAVAEPVLAPTVGLASGAPSGDPQIIGRGRELVTEKACVGCHIIAGAGGQVGPALNGVVARQGPDFVRRKLTDPTFNNPTSMMPNFGLAADEVEALLAYLATLQRGT